MPHSGSSLLKDARAEYFTHYGFGEDDGYGKRWAKVKLGPIPVWFPNSRAQVRAVRLHRVPLDRRVSRCA